MKLIDTEREALISQLEDACFDHNFGTLNKADFELLMFHHYMESIRKSGTSYTNYEIAKQLGITVQRVVGLKDKEASRFPYDESAWRKQFLECFNTSYMSGEKHVINITDRRLYREQESYLEKKGLGAEYDLNPSIFKAEPERFIDAIKSLYPGNDALIETLEMRAREDNPVEEDTDKHSKAKVIGKFAADFASSVLSAVISNQISVVLGR